jgi:hypothetical protein
MTKRKRKKQQSTPYYTENLRSNNNRRYIYGEGTHNENIVPNQNSIIIFPENGNNIVFHFFLEVAELK